jgi:SAM-dependent methyltransferase
LAEWSERASIPGEDDNRGAASQAGQAIYSPTTLALYDLVVLKLSNPFVWRCPTARILALYDRCVAESHLDVGVGTGWYLDRCRFANALPRVGLLDLNPHSLAAASRRIARYQPEQYRADVLRPLEFSATPFRSMALTYLLHCLPGELPEKARALDNLAPLLAPDGIVFGATLLSTGVVMSSAARALMRLYNRKAVFSNTADSLPALRSALNDRFRLVEIEVVGCAALFMARTRR